MSVVFPDPAKPVIMVIGIRDGGPEAGSDILEELPCKDCDELLVKLRSERQYSPFPDGDWRKTHRKSIRTLFQRQHIKFHLVSKFDQNGPSSTGE